MNPFSNEGAVDQLNIFNLPSTQSGVENIYYTDVRPINQNYDSVVEFNFPKNDSAYLYPKGSRMLLTFRVVKEDGSECTDADKYVPIDCLLHTMWSDVVVKLNSKQISNSVGHYAYKSVFNNTFNRFLQSSKLRHAQEFHAPDVGSDFDELPPSDDSGEMKNYGAFIRYTLTRKSKQCTAFGPIVEDFFAIDKFIPPNQDLSVAFFRNSDDFCLIAAEGSKYKIEIIDICIRMCCVQLFHPVFQAHQDALKSSPAIFPLKQQILKDYTVPAGVSSFTWNNVNASDQLPGRLCVAFVAEKAYLGSRTNNPFNFEHFNVSSIGLYSNDQMSCQPHYKLNYEQSYYPEAYNSLMEASESPISIHLTNFDRGYALYMFFILDLNPVHTDLINRKQKGELTLNVTFDKSTPKTLKCLAWSEYDASLKIEQNRFTTVE